MWEKTRWSHHHHYIHIYIYIYVYIYILNFFFFIIIIIIFLSKYTTYICNKCLYIYNSNFFECTKNQTEHYYYYYFTLFHLFIYSLLNYHHHYHYPWCIDLFCLFVYLFILIKFYYKNKIIIWHKRKLKKMWKFNVVIVW